MKIASYYSTGASYSWSSSRLSLDSSELDLFSSLTSLTSSIKLSSPFMGTNELSRSCQCNSQFSKFVFMILEFACSLNSSFKVPS